MMGPYGHALGKSAIKTFRVQVVVQKRSRPSSAPAVLRSALQAGNDEPLTTEALPFAFLAILCGHSCFESRAESWTTSACPLRLRPFSWNTNGGVKWNGMLTNGWVVEEASFGGHSEINTSMPRVRSRCKKQPKRRPRRKRRPD